MALFVVAGLERALVLRIVAVMDVALTAAARDAGMLPGVIGIVAILHGAIGARLVAVLMAGAGAASAIDFLLT
ncbi:hypothetical protein [Caulobacter sp.]|uniref:hypothetical protein n=1 Tax=Caulobacter sp. TaxID=78 RepID=UPI001B0F95E7|nr:hypothetical protein [Caulobacter sp.]MBO9545802.1 hypothetical protein [Caulobacter sp.]